MNNSSIINSIIIISIGVSLTNCSSFSNSKNINEKYTKINVEKKAIVETTQEVATAQKEVNSDYQKFIKEANSKIRRNEKNISELKLKSVSDLKTSNVRHFNKLELIEKKNLVIKQKLYQYELDGSGNWLAFKAELYHDINELELAYNNAAAN